MADNTNYKDLANAIRALSMDAVQRANSGHPGMPMGAADVATVLFTKHLKFDAANPDWWDRDRFVLSAGHGSMLLYSLLYLNGYPKMDMEQIKNFRQLGSRTAGHPEYGEAPGIEMTTGPLGQGVATAVGMAIAERLLAARFGDDIVDHYTYALAGDGCLMEGVSHEAISMAGHLKLGKLIVLFDDNQITIDGSTDVAVGDDQLARFTASGWDVCRVDGHDPEAIDKAIAAAKKSDKPSLIACRTVIGFGAPTKAGSASTHGSPLGDEEIKGAREKLGWPYPPFEIPEEILSAWRAFGARGASEREAWQKRVDGMAADKAALFKRTLSGELPATFNEVVDQIKRTFSEKKPKLATRISSKQSLDGLFAALPELLGGSADLTGSNGTLADGQRSVTPSDFSGAYMHYGVREHGMAAAMNGIALHGGFIPYGGTFLVFSDYCRPSIRLSALMGIRVVYVMTHDSIGLGEDGPTHQPVEHVAALRAIPNVNVFRPADAVEAAESWAVAIQSRKTPSVLALTRQNLPTVRTEHTTENLTAKGAYVLAEAGAGAGARKVTLLATGSEVEIALKARDGLEAEGVATAVVSVPCMELFFQQSDDYRASVLGKGTAKVAVEAAIRQGWDALVGPDGGFVGMASFGASAPAPQLYEKFGITPEAVIQAARERL